MTIEDIAEVLPLPVANREDVSAMRDSEIDHVLGIIGNAWKQQPEMRLGQLLLVATLGKEPTDLFSVADTVLARKVDEFAKRPKNSN